MLTTLLAICSLFLSDALAKTPSFVLQQIEDEEGDFYLAYQKDTINVIAKTYDLSMLKIPFATNLTQCKIEPGDIHGSMSPANDIKYVTYVSDGEELSGKIWLSKPIFSLGEDSLSRSLWWKHLLVLNTTVKDNPDFLETLLNRTLSAIQPKFNILALQRILLANNTPAQIITYEYKSSKDSATYTSILTHHEDKGLIVTYHVPRAQYDNSSQIVEDMTDWIFTHPGYLTYSDEINGISIEHPIDWTISPEDETGFISNLGTTFNSSTYFFPGNKGASLYPSLYFIIEDVPPGKNISSIDYVNTDVDRSLNYSRNYGGTVNNFEFSSFGENQSESRYEHTYNIEGIEYQNLNTIIRNNEKVYYFQYLSKKAEYQDYLPIIKNMIQSFSRNIDDNKPYLNKIGRTQIMSPLTDAFSDLFVNEVSYVSPTSKINVIPWQQPNYFMRFLVDSSYSEPIFYNQIKWNTTSLNWDNSLVQVTPKYEFLKTLNQTHNFTTFYEPGNNYIDFTYDLEPLNYPDKFKIQFYTKYDYIKDGRYCPIVDKSDWGFVPTPEFNVTASPSSLNLRPGDQNDISLIVKSNAQEDYQINFLAEQTNNSIIATFSPNNISVPVAADAISNLEVKALANASLGPASLPINMSIIFVNEAVSLNLNEIIRNPTIATIAKDFSLTINILPPDFKIGVYPPSLDLRRGDKKDLQVQLNSSSNLNSMAMLNATPPDPLKVTFVPNTTYVNPLGVANTILHIEIPREAKEISYSIPIKAKIVTSNISELVSEAGNISLESSGHSVDVASLLTVTVLPDLTFEQHLENLSKMLNPLNLILGFLTAVSAVLAPIIVRIYSRRRRAEKNNVEEKV